MIFEKGKSTNALMRYIRNNHNMSINGNGDKKSLINMEYYYGYKRYRFVKSTSNIQNFDDFSKIKAIYTFDFELKSIFYPMITLVGTGMKNRTIDVVTNCQNPDIESVYKTKLIDYWTITVLIKKKLKNLEIVSSRDWILDQLWIKQLGIIMEKIMR